MQSKTLILAAAGALGGLLILQVIKSAGDMPGTGQAMGAGVTGLVGGVATGAVLGVGDVLGVPRTNQSQGQAELDAGDYWNASFHLPAGEFISGAWNRLTN